MSKPLIESLRSALLEAERQHKTTLDLRDKLKESTYEATCLENRYCQLVQEHEALEQRYHELTKHQQALPDGGGAADGPLSSCQQPAAPPTPPQTLHRTSHGSLPPVLPLEASRLLPGADPEIGYCTSDLEQAVHEFGACLSIASEQHAASPFASELLSLAKGALLGGAVQDCNNQRSLTSLHPCFFGHLLMHWIYEHVWCNPLAALGCQPSLALGPLTHGSGEANLLSLIRSHAARRWCEVTKAMVNDSCEGAGQQNLDAAAAAASAPSGAGRAFPSDACAWVGQSVSRLHMRLGGWLGGFPDLAAIAKNDKHFPALLLRALHLGLFAVAAHPLMRVWVSPATCYPPRDRQYLLPLNESHAERRCITLSTGHGSPNAPLGAKHVLCSLQPGVRMWAAADGLELGRAGRVVVQEEVLTFMWCRPGFWDSGTR